MFMVVLCLDGKFDWLANGLSLDDASDAAREWSEANPGKGFAVIVQHGVTYGSMD